MTPELTPSQTVGPFFHDALLRGDAIAPAHLHGPGVRIVGAVFDGAGDGVPDAVLEAWQGNVFCRVGTGDGGRYEFTTTRPSASAAFIDVTIFARGLLNQLATRIYLVDDTPPTADALLALVPPDRRATLVARREPAGGDGLPTYRFDIVLQGRDETVFFDAR